MKKSTLWQAAMKLALVACVLLAPLGLKAQTQNATLYDGTNTNSYVPMYTSYCDNGFTSEYIIPASAFEENNIYPGSLLHSITLYQNQTNPWVAVDLTIKLTNTETESYSSAGLLGSSGTTVYTNASYSANSASSHTYEFSSSFEYTGGSLIVQISAASGGTWKSSSWYGTNTTTNQGYYIYSSYTGSLQKFIPKTTFNYTPGEAPASPKPTNFAVSNILHNQADLSWTENGTATSWQICVNGDEENPITVTTNPYTLTGLTPLTAYTVKVRSVGTPNSDWSASRSFNTTAQAEAVGDSWSDDFEGASCGWELVNGNLTNANWAWGTAVNNGGTHAIYISNDGGTTNAYSTSGYAKVYATKLLNFAASKYTFSFDWKCNGESTYDFLRVGLVPASTQLEASNTSDNTVPTGWVALDNGNNLSAQTTWQHVDKTIQIPAGNYYLVLRWRQDNGGGSNPPAAVDNVSITRVACPYDVEDLAVTPSSITTTGATITWTAGEATQWQVAYSANSNFEDATEVIVSAATYGMTNLTHSTYYYVRVRAYCGGSDYGAWSAPIKFPTVCEALTINENTNYIENFDGMTASSTYSPAEYTMPICWNLINNCTYSSYMYYPVVSSYSSNSYAHSGTSYLKFYSFYSSYTDYNPQPQYAILPEMSNLNNARIMLWAKGNNASSTFKIGRMTDPTDASTFQPIEIESGVYEQALTTSYQKFTYNLTGVSGNYIAIMMDAASSSRTTNGVYIDDITVEMIPTCRETSGLAVVDNSITTNSVQLSWTAGGTETAWDIYYTTSNEAPTAETTTPTVSGTADNPCTVSGLNPSTHYYAYVRARCSESDKSPWSEAVEFNTACASITSFPWTENFEEMTDNTVPLCWDNSATTGTDHGSHPEYYWGVYNYNGNKMIRMYNYYAHGPLAIINTPVLDLPADPQDLTFEYAHHASSGEFTVKISTDNGTTFTDLQSFSAGSGYSQTDPGTFTEAEISLADYANSSVILQFYSAANYGSGAIFIDNVKIDDSPTCRKPSTLVCSSKTAHTATLSWGENGSATAWQVSYSTEANFDPENGTIVDVNANPATIEGFNQSATYYAYVRANCGNVDGVSDWNTTKVTFTTLAGNVTPSGLTVDNSTITSSQATASWNAVAGNTEHQSYDIYWATADVTEVPAEPTAPNLISGITATSQVISGLEAETTYKVWVRDNCGTDGYSNWSSTPFTFMTAAACQMPDGLAASNVTNNSATISWNPYGLTEFNLRYSTDGENWTTVNDVNSPYAFNGTLSSNTAYQVQVQASCNTEAWSATLSLKTECDAITITNEHHWTENFDSPEVTTLYNAIGEMPDCWDNYPTTASSAKILAAGAQYNYADNSQVLYFYGSGNNYAALPVFSNALNELQITFKYATESASNGNLTLGYITAEDNGTYNTFTAIGSSYNASQSYYHVLTPITAYLNNVPAEATRLVFRWYYSTQYGANVDDIEVSPAPSCYPLGTLTYANVGTHSVDLSWPLVDANQTAWQVQYATDENFTEGVNTIVANAHENYTLTGLTPNEVHYWVRVRAKCGNDDYSEWSNVVNFTTGIACHAPTTLTASNETTTSMDLSWTNGDEGQNAWVIAYKKEGDADFTEVNVAAKPYTLTGLTDGKTYTLKVRANCGNVDGLSQWSGEITHATVASCPTPTNVAYSDVNPHGATITWDGEADNHNIEYRTVTTAEFDETYDLEGGSMPTGWTHIGNGSVDYQTSYSHSTSHSIKFSGATSDNILVLPDLGLEINTMTISYWSKAESASNSGEFDMGYVTDPADASTFHAIHTNSASTDGASYTEVSDISLSAAPAGARIAFRHRSGYSSWYWFLDDIHITANYVSGYGAWQTVDDVTSPHELYTLNPETIYEVRVIGDCGATTSPASDVMTFTTGIACYAPENFAVDNSTITHNSVELSWTATGGTTTWVVAYKADGDANFTEVENVTENAPYLLEGLDPETHYTVKVKSDCGSEGYSSWSEEKTFTTIEACAAPTAFVLGNVTAHQASFSWTAGNGNTAWKVYVKEHAAAEYPSTYTNATTASATISELDDATAYDVKIVPTCNESKILEVENAFTTLCEAVTTFPWTEDFNSLTENYTIPVCWDNEEGTTTNANYRWCYNATTGYGNCNGTGQNGSNCVRFNSFNNSNNFTNFLKSPVLSLPAGQPLQLKFWYKNPTGGDFSVYISTDGGDTYETALATGLTGKSGWTGHEAIDLSAYAGQDVVIVFKGTSNYGNGDAYIYLDDVTVEPLTIEKIVDLNKWYAISSPMDAPSVLDVTNLINGTYDLFRYDEPTGTWQNYKASNFDFENGRGYIYRRTTSAILTFNGTPNVSGVSYNLTASCADATLKGFNLVGNPYMSKAGISTSCYTLNANGTWTVHESYEIEMTEGVMVHTNSATALQFTAISSKSAPTATEALAITVSGNGYEDIVYARLEDGEGMPKLGHLTADAPALSIPVDGSRYAIAMLGTETESFPLTLQAAAGTYTIGIKGSDNMSYVHLLDRATGRDIDLMSQTYTFSATGSDANRFMVKLSPYTNEPANGTFAVWNGNGWRIDGDGTLQVYDVMGRKLFARELSEFDGYLPVQIFPATGVYVIRLGEKSQKIVVK